jgi:hypothetical protein
MVADGKNDLNRVGWFSEMGYISIGDPYKPKKNGIYPTDRLVVLYIVRHYNA